MTLSYKLRGISPNTGDVQGKERVFFTCHPADFDKYFTGIAEDIHRTQNCVIYFTNDMNEELSEDDLNDIKSRAQILVFPVTTQFLYHPNRARDVELPFALENHISVLPIMVVPGLESEFNRICGDLQLLDRNSSGDLTTAPYAEKLEKYLNSVLLGDEMAAKVRESFDAYIFLSYRKKDRRYAQELMKKIHQNDFCRDIAIWYDEYLIPGESFNEAIVDAIKKSDLFTLLVTPNLLEMPGGRPNYIMEHEYKDAKEAGKAILPAEVIKTDSYELRKYYSNIPDTVNANESDKLSKSLATNLERLDDHENNDDPEHLYYIGHAYYSGIDVEVDHDKAIELFTKAAEAGSPLAMDKLARVFSGEDRNKVNFDKAAYWGGKLVEHFRHTLGDEHASTLASINDLAVYLSRAGRIIEAFALNEELLALHKRILGDEHPNTLSVMGNLAISYSKAGRIKDSLALNEEVLALHKRILGDEHPNTLLTMGNLAGSYRDTGRIEEALALNEEALTLRKRILGEEHPDTLRSMSDLAVSYSDVGRIEEALTLRKEALALHKRILGDEHPATLSAMSNLANSYSDTGRIEEALGLNEKVLAVRKRILGDEHPAVLMSKSNLANSYRDAGHIEEALTLHEEVLTLFKRILGEKNPVTLMSKNNLAKSYIDVGRIEEALALNEEVLTLNKLIHGDEHPYTLSSMSNLAANYRDAGRKEEALALNEEALVLHKRILGDEHPATLSAMSNLANSYSDAGRIEEALGLNEKVLAIRKRILGDEHPDTLTSMNNLAYEYYAIGRIEEAIELSNNVLEGYKRILGDRHPDTLRAMNNLIYLHNIAGKIDEENALRNRMRELQADESNGAEGS